MQTESWENEDLRVNKVFRASPVLSDLLEIPDQRDNVVCLDRRALKETPVQWVNQVPLVLRVSLVSTELRDNAAQLVSEVNPVLWVLPEDPELQEHPEAKEKWAPLVDWAPLVSRELPETLVALASQVHRVNQVHLGPRVPRVNLVLKVEAVQWASPVHLEHLENEDFLVSLAHLVHLDSADRLVLEEKLELQESVELKVQWVLLASQDLPVPLVSLETPVHPVLMANPVLLVFLDAQETKDHPALPVQLAVQDPLVFLDLLAQPDLLVPLESAETEEKLVLRVWKVLLALEASPERQALRAKRERPEHWDQREQRVTAVSLVSKVCLVHMVLRETRVLLERSVRLVPSENLVPKVHLDVTEALVFRVLWVHPVPEVPLVKKVHTVPQVPLVPLVLLVLLETKLATTRPSWMLF